MLLLGVSSEIYTATTNMVEKYDGITELALVTIFLDFHTTPWSLSFPYINQLGHSCRRLKLTDDNHDHKPSGVQSYTRSRKYRFTGAVFFGSLNTDRYVAPPCADEDRRVQFRKGYKRTTCKQILNSPVIIVHLIRRSGLADRYNTALRTLSLDLTSGWGFATETRL
jgi:hypothetical protein